MKNYRFNINGKDYDVAVNSISDGKASVTVNGTEYTVDCASEDARTPAAAPVNVKMQPGNAAIHKTVQAEASAPSVGGKKVEAPLPGVIIGLYINEGQNVKRGQRIAVLEAMKMENDILSPIDGTVREVSVQRGDSVLEGSKIAVIA